MRRVLVVLVALSAPALAGPADPDPLIGPLEAHWTDLDFDLVLAGADELLARPGLRLRQRLEALRLKGSALVVLDRPDEAVATFEQLFALDPAYELPPSTSPRILEVFQPAHARWLVRQEEILATELGGALTAVDLQVAVPTAARGGRPLAVTVTLRDPGRIVADVLLAHRKRGARLYSIIAVHARPGTTTLVIPAVLTAAERDYVLEYYVRARHRSGLTLRRVGDADAPMTTAMAAGRVPRPVPVVRRWWFWTGVAALSVAAVSVPILIDRSRDVGPQELVGRR